MKFWSVVGSPDVLDRGGCGVRIVSTDSQSGQLTGWHNLRPRTVKQSGYKKTPFTVMKHC